MNTNHDAPLAPIYKVNYRDVTETGRLYEFCTCASDIGIGVGENPLSISTDEIGNGQPFVLVRIEKDRSAFNYRQAHGIITLVVFND